MIDLLTMIYFNNISNIVRNQLVIYPTESNKI